MSHDPYYQNDGITLYLGDCREHLEWLAADVLVTDPPYGIGYRRNFGGYLSSGQCTWSESPVGLVAGDEDTAARDHALAMWGDMPWVVFGSWRSPRPAGTEHRLIWNKEGQAPGLGNYAFVLQDEEIYVAGRGFRKSSPPQRSVITTHEARQNQTAKVGHPTSKPLDLMQILIDRCPPGVVADPFAGSGSTLVAARLQGRGAIGVEIDESYCEIVARRLDQGVMEFPA